MLSVEEALEAILAAVTALPAQPTPLLRAAGLVLAEDVQADIDNPPFDNSAVDGYAVRAADTEGASDEHPVWLREVESIGAGHVASVAVSAGACVRTMTGAPVPDGADAMVMVEDTEATPAGVAVRKRARAGDHIRRRGEDVRAGALLLERGAVVGAAETAMLAAMGRPEPLCVRAPRVAVLSTGDELVDIDRVPGPGQIRDSNRYTLASLAAAAGAQVVATRHAHDDEAAIEAALRALSDPGGPAADALITTGGVSVGDRDFVKPVVERLGRLDLWRVKMKPGKPVAFGRVGGALFFGLPGNPVSAMVTFELFVRPALWTMAGRARTRRPAMPVAVTADVRHKPGRREYVRAAVRLHGGRFEAHPTGAQGSGMLSSMLGANALLVIPDDAGDVRAGDVVEALLLDAEAVL